MPFNTRSSLWSDRSERYFEDRSIQPLVQTGPHCVSTVLAMLSCATPEEFQGVINTQDPVSWSGALQKYGLKLAYCPSDFRKVRFYAQELAELNDLFTISYFLPLDAQQISKDPRESDGWVCGSHIVIIHGGDIIDPARGDRVPVSQHSSMERFTKRIFRVVPVDHSRGL